MLPDKQKNPAMSKHWLLLKWGFSATRPSPLKRSLGFAPLPPDRFAFIEATNLLHIKYILLIFKPQEYESTRVLKFWLLIRSSIDYGADMNEIPSVPSPGILQNDSDIENDPLTAILEAHVTDGVLNFNTDGLFSYKPPDNFMGKITFSY